MTSIFVHTDFIPGDKEGFGLWRSEHAYDHQALNAAARANNRVVPEYDILSWQEDPMFQKFWNGAHYDMHLVLRDITGISGVDYSDVDWSDNEQVFIFLENHAAEHELLGQVFNI